MAPTRFCCGILRTGKGTLAGSQTEYPLCHGAKLSMKRVKSVTLFMNRCQGAECKEGRLMKGGPYAERMTVNSSVSPVRSSRV